MDAKKFYLSKTVIFNVVAVILVVAVKFGYREFEPDPDVYQYGAMLYALINLFLRFATNKPVEL